MDSQGLVTKVIGSLYSLVESCLLDLKRRLLVERTLIAFKTHDHILLRRS